MARVTVEDCIDKVSNRFDLVLLAAHRAREISSGSSLTIERNNDKNPVVALREIADETIPVDDLKEKLVQEYQAVSIQSEEDLSLEYSSSDDATKEDDALPENNLENTMDLKDTIQEEDIITKTDIENNEDNQVDNLSQNIEEETS